MYSYKIKYIAIVISHNEIQAIKACSTLVEAQAVAVELANEYFFKDGVVKFFNGNKIENIAHINEYYTSSIYHDFEDSVNVAIEKLQL